MSKIRLSTVTPVYQGESYVQELVDELFAVKCRFDDHEYPIELVEAIFVDDAAIDASPELLDRLQEEYAWVHVIHMSSGCMSFICREILANTLLPKLVFFTPQGIGSRH